MGAISVLTDHVREIFPGTDFTLKDVKNKKRLEKLLDQHTPADLLASTEALRAWYSSPNLKLKKYKNILDKSVLPSTKKTKILRGVRYHAKPEKDLSPEIVSWSNLFLKAKVGDELELPMKAGIGLCSCTTNDGVVRKFAPGESMNWVSVTLELIDPEAHLVVAPPEHSADWLNRLMVLPGRISCYRKSEYEVIVGPPEGKNTLRFRWIEKR